MDKKITSILAQGYFVFCMLLCMSSSAYAVQVNIDPIIETPQQDQNVTISQDTFWYANEVHRVTKDVIVKQGATLTIEAGSIVKFDSSTQLIIEGVLAANGSDAAHIIFTSYRDDSTGGDTNGGATNEVAEPGDWLNIQFKKSADKNLTQLNYIDVRYAGAKGHSALSVEGADIDVSFCTIANNAAHGLAINSDAATVQNCTIKDNAGDGIHAIGSDISLLNNTLSDNAESGIYMLATSGTPTIQNNQISGNRWGLYYDSYNNGDLAVIEQNTITANEAPLHIAASVLPTISDDNVLGPNTRNGIWLKGSDNSLSTDLLLKPITFDKGEINTYYLEQDSIIMASGTKMTVSPGVVIKFNEHTALKIDGQLSAIGTDEKPIVFTSIHDDSYGGDFNLNGLQTMPKHGDWRGVQLGKNSSGNKLEHTVLRYGGGDYDAAIFAYDTDLTISNSLVANSGAKGILSDSSAITIENTEIFANSSQGIYAKNSGRVDISGGRIYANWADGIYYQDAVNGRIETAQIFANIGNGLQNKGEKTVDARGNWWGAKDGPSGDFNGGGAAVSNTGTGAIVVADQQQGILVDGTKFNLFDAGGLEHDNHGINSPIVTGGDASAAWGVLPEDTIIENTSEQQLLIEYSDLETGPSYEVLLTYLSKDPQDTKQTTYDGNGKEIHTAFSLPKNIPSVYSYPIEASSIVDGKLKLDIQAQGPRASVAMVYLLKKGANDITPITITVNEPTDNLFTNQATQIISGELDEAGALTIDGALVDVKDDLSFSHEITLEDGVNTIKMLAIDGGFNFTPKNLTLTLDTADPVLNITTTNLVTEFASQTLSGSLNEAVKELKINGDKVDVNDDLSFSHDITLVSGSNPLTIEAKDRAGNTVTKTVTYTLFVDSSSVNDFVTTWQTTSANQTITIPTTGTGYDYDIDWNNDGYFEQKSVSENASHVYKSTGIHTIRIRGAFPRIYLNNGAQRETIRSVEQWGNGVWSSMESAFDGARELKINTSDAPDLSAVTDMSQMFFRSYVDGDLSAWNVSNVTNMYAMFANTPLFNHDLSTWDVSNVTNMTYMFIGALAFDQDLSAWNVSNVTDMTAIFRDIKLSVANYEALLASWSAQSLKNGVQFDGGNNQYCSTAAQLARTKLINDYGWIITDAGLESNACSPISIADQTFSIDENTAKDIAVGSVVAVEATNSTLSYAITSGNTNNTFAIDAATGEITVNDSTQLDYETTTSYALTVKVEGGTPPLSKTAIITININDVDDTKPVITLTTPAADLVTKETNQTVTGSLSEAVDSFTINGETVTTINDDLTFSDTITLVEGENTLTLTATDPAQNSVTEIVKVTLDSIGPVITVTSPVEGSTQNQSTTTIIGQLSEAGSLKIDDNVVELASDFSFSYPVTLQPNSNSFTLVALDELDNETTQVLTVTLDDKTAPTITIVAPIDDSITNQVDQVISGHFDETATLTVNGIDVTVAEDLTFNGTVTLNEGQNPINFVFKDDALNEESTTVTVTLDSVDPIITITSPADGFTTNTLSQTITGTLSETATLTVNGDNVAVADDLSFSANINLREGSNDISLIATDLANNEGTATTTMMLDVSAPSLTISSPLDGLLTRTAAQTLTGNLATQGSLKVNNNDVTLAADLTFSLPVTLEEGANSYNFVVSDDIGNSDTQVINLTLDTVDPQVAINNITEGEVLQQTITTLEGTLSENASLTINGQAISTDAQRRFTYPVTLAEGNNTYTIVATDDAGNIKSTPYIVHLNDKVSPTITLTSPDVDLITKASSHVITGSLDETATLTLTSNGSDTDITVNADLTFSHNITLVDGVNNFSLAARDAQTNTSTVTLDLTLDNQLPTAPTLTSHVLSPEVNVSAQKAVTVSGSREANSSIWINGVEHVALGSSDWTTAVNLNEGDSTLNVLAKDAADNSSAAIEVLIKVDSIAPVIADILPVAISNTAPNVIQVNFTETGSGIDSNETQLTVVHNASVVAGNLAVNADNVTFTPDTALQEGVYVVRTNLVDNANNKAPVNDYSFTLDFTAPAAPVLATYPTTSSINALTFNGSKDVGTSVWLDGVQVVEQNNQTTWQHQVNLAANDNNFLFVSQDNAGNNSPATPATVTFDDTAPGVVTITANEDGDGTQISLAWNSYDEFANGNDISEYRVYQATSDFTDTNNASLIATVPAGTKTHQVTALTRQQTVYYAVVAADVQSNASNTVTALAATANDIVAPANVTAMNITSFDEHLVINWTTLTGSVDDLASYRLYIDGSDIGTTITAADTSYDLTGLTAATAYSLKLTAVDNDGNENTGTTINAATLLANPAISNTEAYSGLMAITWTHSEPQNLVKAYKIYAETTDFGSSTQGLVAKATVSGDKLKASVQGLTNNTQYWFAVAAVNISDGETLTVTTMTGTPTPDSNGPDLSALSFDGQDLVDGLSITKSGTLHVTAIDKTNVSRVEFLVDGIVIGTDNNGSNNVYDMPWNILTTTDGAHTITLRAVDVLNNETTQNIAVNVALAAPAAPIINQPAADITTNQQQFTISGQSTPHTQVTLFVNSNAVGEALAVNEQGKFTTSITLNEGINNIDASAEFANRGGMSQKSVGRTVTFDQSVPDAPTGFSTYSRSLGEIRLAWNSVVDPRVQGYNVYRSNSPFESMSESGVSKLNSTFITGTAYTDMPANNGTYYYRVTSSNDIGTQSLPSQLGEAVSDSVGPRALDITYTPDGQTDIESGRIAPGLVGIEITFDEALRNVPYFALTREGGVPIVVNLNKDRNDDTIYKGNFVLQNNTASGTYYAALAAHDNYNNRGSEIDAGKTLLVDTSGPEVLELILNPSSPIFVDPALDTSARTLDVSIRLNDTLAALTQPRLIPMLDGVEIQGYSNGINLSRDQASTDAMPIWTGQLILPASAGQDNQGNASVQVLSFDHSAFDDLDNEATEIAGNNQFQVYQGALPPVDIPFNLTAVAKAAGSVELNWEAVEAASGYKLYRQAFDETEMTELTTISGAEVTSFSDTTSSDGLYQYAITSTRTANSQLSESGRSDPVTVNVDGTLPNAPESLQLALNGAGNVLRWSAPTGEANLNTLTYNVYRLAIDQDEAVDLQGVTPLQTKIPNLASPIALDAQPSRDARTYVITAVDAAGNESAPSNAVTQAITLLPVANLAINLQEEGYPQLSWSHNNTHVQGYDIYLGPVSDGIKLNVLGLTSEKSFTDTSYNNGAPSNGGEQQRQYTVVAIDDQDTQSVGHSLLLPSLSVSLDDSTAQQLERGIFNKVMFRVANSGDVAAQNIRLFVTVNDDGTQRQHQSAAFTIEANGFALVPVVIGGYASLDNLGELQLRLHQTPQTGEQVNISQSDSIAVGDSLLSVRLATQNFTRGTTGQARFTVENTSEIETELLLARGNGKHASSQLRLIIEDLDGNTLSTKAVQQFGGGAITTVNGNSVARIAAGESFTSDLIDIAIPGASPDQISLRLEIDRYHHHLDRPDHVQIKGGVSRKEFNLIDTEYFAQITSISESVVYGSEPIVIKGQSIDRNSNLAVGNVAVKLVFSINGFERSSTINSNNMGEFEYTYVPANNDSGRYQVSAIHPDVVDRPNHGEFVVQVMDVVTKDFNLKIPQNFDQAISIRVNSGRETPLTNLRVSYEAQDQVNGTAPEGITVSTAAPVNVAASKTAYLRPIFRASQSAQANGMIRLRVSSDDAYADPLGFVTVNYVLSAAAPSLSVASPGYVETGVGLGKNITEKLTISNKGLADLSNIKLSLTELDETTPAPSWLYLASSRSISKMAVGDKQTINITVSPSDSIAEADYEFRLKISSDELIDKFVPVYVAVTQSGIGDVFFHTSDIYTATLDEYGHPIPGLAGAKIKLQNEQVLTEQYDITSDANGEALLADIPSGRYIYRVSARDHQDVSGRLIVKPGVTVSEEVFLMNEIITVEFSVKEITIQDRYEIILKATYETSVPVAVVVAEPQSINLPVMKKGETFLGEIRLTNHGLIEAYDVTPHLPASSGLINVEFLQEVPNRLAAGAVVILPYRLTAINNFNPDEDGDASGGGCGSLYEQACYSNTCTCVNGAIVDSSTCSSWFSNWGSCGGGSVPIGTRVIRSGNGGGNGGGTSYRSTAQGIGSVEPECLAAGGNECGTGGNSDAE